VTTNTRDYLHLSAQDVDPLSWFAGPALPRTFAVLTFIYGMIATIADWNDIPTPAAQVVAVVLMTSSLVALDLFTRPTSARFDNTRLAVTLAPAWLAITVSALWQKDDPVQIEQWWASLGLGIVLGAIGPYISVVRVWFVSITSMVLAGVLSVIVFLPSQTFWPPVSLVLIGIVSVGLGLAAGTAINLAIVPRLLRWAADERERASDAVGNVDEVDPTPTDLDILAARVAPFIESVAVAGVVTEIDRSVAAQLARGLRDDLVTRANRSWLDTIARDQPLTVLDPEHRAEGMRMPQRAALRGLLMAVFENPALDRSSVLIELRGREDGSTAVALTMDLDLPEGRRVMLLAPYYLTLKTTVHDLSWDSGKLLGLTFQLPPEQ
jgi:hypothetical protein